MIYVDVVGLNMRVIMYIFTPKTHYKVKGHHLLMKYFWAIKK